MPLGEFKSHEAEAYPGKWRFPGRDPLRWTLAAGNTQFYRGNHSCPPHPICVTRVVAVSGHRLIRKRFRQAEFPGDLRRRRRDMEHLRLGEAAMNDFG